MSSRARVLVLNSALGPLDYRVPAGMTVQPGSIVVAPLGPRQLLGVVWEPERMPSDAEVGDNRLRPLLGVADAPPLPTPLRRLIEWTADYYLAPPAAVVRMALSSTSALEGARTVTEYRVTGHVPDRLTPQRAQALERIGDRQGLIRELATMADVSDAVIRGLVKNGAIEEWRSISTAPSRCPTPIIIGPNCRRSARGGGHAGRGRGGACVSTGATRRRHRLGQDRGLFRSGGGGRRRRTAGAGSAPRNRADRAVLETLPRPLRLRAGGVAFGLRSSQRRRAWRAIASGQGLVTVGARSALFLPYRNLGLIVVDEAHETSFKQEDGVHYHARDVAVMRGKFEPCPVILASATPAIETRQQVALGRYTEVKLPGRFGPAQMPTIEAIDLIQNPPERGRWIAPKLVAAMKETLEKREQSLLYLNRRGYAPLTLCRTCGHRFQCPNCTAWMVEHRLVRRLACHHCGHVMPTPRACPECGGEDSLVACGPGVERIADEATALFPEAKIAVVTSDTIWSPAKAAEFVGRMEAGDIDIVVGTQLITKGYHFPNLTLVGVIDADLGLDGGDLRAAERTFQQIRQVSGRAGRGAKPGHVFIQTHSPKAQVMQALVTGDAEAFYTAETEARRDADAPPSAAMPRSSCRRRIRGRRNRRPR
ncbi:Primosomal protein N' [Sphingomonas paucimobilis]|nr:Primosomal protein N' [Sphingomonas paucimobilis]